ncbi:Sec-independent protein translocase subunit TatA [Kitasatospora sp. NPDC059803]|uniref:Sec-independent protein translocase subunit TatA n=1 Tax=Kitasatospora sp. NPDC059803 TaxID=3346953 RepID=UPI003651AC9C
MRISMTAIVVVVIFAVLLFGAKRLPDLARSLGQSMRILKSETKAMRSDGAEEDAAATPPPAPRVDGGSATTAARTIQAAPGASGTARPVAEPAAGPSAADSDRPR